MIPSTRHPATAAICTDAGSIGHLLLGWIAGGLSPEYALSIFALFAGYQVSQHPSGEQWDRIGGELFEFGLGLIVRELSKR